MEIFAQATRNNVTFNINYPNLTRLSGQVNVIDVWQLSKNVLAALYDDVCNELEKVSGTKQLFSGRAKSNNTKELELKKAILEYVANTLTEEEKENEEAANKRIKRQRLMELKAQKQEQQMLNLSEEEIDAMLSELD